MLWAHTWRFSIFGAATFARGLTWSLADMFLGYQLYARSGLGSETTGLILFVLLLCGALADVAAGALLVRRATRQGAVFAMQRIGAIISAVTLVPLFVPALSLLAALFWGILFRTAFSFYAIPQTTLLSLLPMNSLEQINYVKIYASLGAVARVLTAIFGIFFIQSSGLSFSHFHLCGVVIISALIVSSVFALEAVMRRRTLKCVSSAETSRYRAQTKGLIWALVATSSHACAVYMMSRLFLFTPQAAPIGDLGPWLLIAWAVGLAIGPCLLGRVKGEFMGGICAIAISSCLLALPQGPMLLLLPIAMAYGIGLSLTGVELLRIVAHIAHGQGSASAGLFFAAYAFTVKLAMAVGNGLLAFLLDGFVVGSPTVTTALILINLAGCALCAASWRYARSTSIASRDLLERSSMNKMEERQ